MTDLDTLNAQGEAKGWIQIAKDLEIKLTTAEQQLSEAQQERDALRLANKTLSMRIEEAFDDGYRHADESLRGEVAQQAATIRTLKIALEQAEYALSMVAQFLEAQ